MTAAHTRTATQTRTAAQFRTAKHTRRAFLTALGAGIGCFLSGSRSFAEAPGSAAKVTGGAAGRATAAGAETAPPLRFFGVYTPHGCAYEYFPPAEGFRFDYEGAVLRPFEELGAGDRPLKEHLTIVDGIDLSAGLLTGTAGHEAARVILTGSGADGKNASIDQFLAVDQGFGNDTIFTSLVLGVGNDQSGHGNNISYARGGTELPKQIDPRALFADLFGTPVTGKSREQLAHERALGMSILDFARSDLRALSKRAPPSERLKLEQHQTALRDLEKRLTREAPRCESPAEPREFPRLRAYGGGEPAFDEITNLMIDLSVRAMACDLTRFCTLYLNDLSRTNHGGELPADIHQGVAHKYQARSEHSPGNPASWQALAAQNRYSYSKVARLARGLDDAGLLGDSIVYVSSDMGDPARHSSRHVPSLLVGGAGGKWAGGKTLKYEPSRALPNNRILVSIAQAFGVETDRFGDSASSGIVTGDLSQQLAARALSEPPQKAALIP